MSIFNRKKLSPAQARKRYALHDYARTAAVKHGFTHTTGIKTGAVLIHIDDHIHIVVDAIKIKQRLRPAIMLETLEEREDLHFNWHDLTIEDMTSTPEKVLDGLLEAYSNPVSVGKAA